MSTTVETSIDVRPFHVQFRQDEIDELRRRVQATSSTGATTLQAG